MKPLHPSRGIALAALLGFGTLTGCGANVGPSAQMSLRRVVLYRNGLGYFERSGDIAQPTLPLRFSAHEVDDVLATMTLQSASGQTVMSASVPQRQPSESDGDVVTVELRLSEARANDLTLSYSVPTPAWRSSYRIVLPDEENGEGDALFQIWALVHNSSPEDWNHVSLALSTGAPISYEVDQRTPEFVARPDASGQLVAPTVLGTVIAERSGYDRGLAAEANGREAVAYAEMPAPAATGARYDLDVLDESIAGGGAAAGTPRGRAYAGRAVPADGTSTPTSIGPTATSIGPSSLPVAVEGTTRYDVSAPVSIPAHSSSLVTILSERVRGESVLLFAPNPSAPGSDSHPFRAARLTTPDTTTLIPGPVAIYAGGSFVGQALVSSLHEGETATLPYAIDGSTQVLVTNESASEPSRLVSIARGVLTVEDRSVRRTRFEVRPGSHAPARIFVRHERLAGHTARNLPDGTEQTDTAYLVPVTLEPGVRNTLVVEEVTPVRRSFAMLDLRVPVLPYVEATGDLPSALRAQLRDVLALRARLGEAEERVADMRERLEDQARSTAELRQNLEALGTRPSDVRRALEERLRQAFGRFEALQGELADLQAHAAAMRAELGEAIGHLALEPADEPASS